MKFMTKLENIIMNRTGCDRGTANLVANDILDENERAENAVYLPCNVGDTVYVICDGRRLPGVRRVTNINIRDSDIIVTVRNERTYEYDSYFGWQFGRQIFTSLSDADKALESKGGGNENDDQANA